MVRTVSDSNLLNYMDYASGEISPATERRISKQENAPDIDLPWHQRPKESDAAFKAFAIYLDMGIDRSHSGVAQVLYGNPDNKTSIQEWARKFDWESRATQFDRMQGETRNQQTEEAVRQSEELARRFLPKVTQRLSQAAAGELKGEKITGGDSTIMRDFMDRYGPAKQSPQAPVTINNWNVKYPELPSQVSEKFDVEDAEFEEISDHADNLIPDKLKR